MTTEPWTFEDFEEYKQKCYEIYDPNLARIVAHFYDKQEMENYLTWRNNQQNLLRVVKKFASG